MDTKKKDIKRVWTYLGITFTITYLYEFLVVWPLAKSLNPSYQSMQTIAVAVAMFFPAIGVILTRLFTKEGFKNAWIVPKKFKKTFRYYLYAWFIFVILSVIGAAIYFVCFPEMFDKNMSYLVATYAAAGLTIDTSQALKITIIQGLLGTFAGPILNFIPCFGEEWGWRGYLLPKTMGKLPVFWMLLVNGVIWGVWHAPITMLGHNYGTDYVGFPILGILAMSYFCTCVGAILSYFSWKAKSCIPGVIGHASLNAVAGLGFAFLLKPSNALIGPNLTGIVGGSAMLVCAVICAFLLRRDVKAEAANASEQEVATEESKIEEKAGEPTNE